MAFLANTAFEARGTNNEFDALCNITGKYKVSTVESDCSAGLLCVRGDNLPCEGFTGVVNENAYYMTAAASTVTANDAIYACNTYEAKMIDQYYIGSETLGLGVPAGRYGTFTRINFDNVSKYRFGIGNVSGTITASDVYFTIDDGLLVPDDEVPSTAGTPYFLLKNTGNFVEGTTNSFGFIDVEAHIA